MEGRVEPSDAGNVEESKIIEIVWQSKEIWEVSTTWKE